MQLQSNHAIIGPANASKLFLLREGVLQGVASLDKVFYQTAPTTRPDVSCIGQPQAFLEPRSGRTYTVINAADGSAAINGIDMVRMATTPKENVHLIPAPDDRVPLALVKLLDGSFAYASRSAYFWDEPVRTYIGTGNDLSRLTTVCVVRSVNTAITLIRTTIGELMVPLSGNALAEWRPLGHKAAKGTIVPPHRYTVLEWDDYAQISA